MRKLNTFHSFITHNFFFNVRIFVASNSYKYLDNKYFHLILVFISDLKAKLAQISPQSEEQPCDLRLFTPATCLIEFRAAVAAAAQVQNLSQASTANNNTAHTSSAIGQSSSQQIPFIKGLGLLPRSSIVSANQQREHNEREKTRTSNSSVSSQLSPLLLTPIQSLSGAPYSCSRCGNTYARPHSLNRHIRFECGKICFLIFFYIKI